VYFVCTHGLPSSRRRILHSLHSKPIKLKSRYHPPLHSTILSQAPRNPPSPPESEAENTVPPQVNRTNNLLAYSSIHTSAAQKPYTSCNKKVFLVTSLIKLPCSPPLLLPLG
jgi:hypothetical protein